MTKGKGFTQEEIEAFQKRRAIISLYKSFLIMLEDLIEEHIQHFNKLRESFRGHERVIDQADWFTEDRLSYLRKKVLDAGNDCVRKVLGEENGNEKGKRQQG